MNASGLSWLLTCCARGMVTYSASGSAAAQARVPRRCPRADPVAVHEQRRHRQPVRRIGVQRLAEHRAQDVQALPGQPVRVDLPDVPLDLGVAGGDLSSRVQELLTTEHEEAGERRDRDGGLPGVAGGRVARGVGHDERGDPGGVPVDDFLGDVPAQAQADEADPVDVQRVEQRGDVVDGVREGERSRCRRFTVRPQVRHHYAVPGPQRLHLGLPRPVVEGGAVQEHQRRPVVATSGPVPDRRVGADQLMSVQEFTFVSGRFQADVICRESNTSLRLRVIAAPWSVSDRRTRRIASRETAHRGPGAAEPRTAPIITVGDGCRRCKQWRRLAAGPGAAIVKHTAPWVSMSPGGTASPILASRRDWLRLLMCAGRRLRRDSQAAPRRRDAAPTGGRGPDGCTNRAGRAHVPGEDDQGYSVPADTPPARTRTSGRPQPARGRRNPDDIERDHQSKERTDVVLITGSW